MDDRDIPRLFPGAGLETLARAVAHQISGFPVPDGLKEAADRLENRGFLGISRELRAGLAG